MADITVGIADCKVSNNPGDVLIAHGLGSCIAVVLYDPAAKVAGLLHYMLPESDIDADQAIKRPCMFADTGIQILLQGCYQLGAKKWRSVFMAAGGARILDKDETFNVGKRNCDALQKIFNTSRIVLRKQDIGGTISRTIRISVSAGTVHLTRSGGPENEMVVDLKRIAVGNGSQLT